MHCLLVVILLLVVVVVLVLVVIVRHLFELAPVDSVESSLRNRHAQASRVRGHDTGAGGSASHRRHRQLRTLPAAPGHPARALWHGATTIH